MRGPLGTFALTFVIALSLIAGAAYIHHSHHQTPPPVAVQQPYCLEDDGQLFAPCHELAREIEV